MTDSTTQQDQITPHAGIAIKAIYALGFCAILPAALVLWASIMPRSLPSVRLPLIGIPLFAIGIVLLITGMWSLWHRGGGLPMNIAPPPRLVTSGVYTISRHPIYLGFSLTCIGLSLLTGSAAGLWVISPLLVLACFALVWGYERHDLIARFGPAYDDCHPLLSLPPAADAAPTFAQRLGVALVVLLPWLALYEAAAQIPTSPHALSTFLDFERNWPVLPWTELIYGSAYLGVTLAPFLIARQSTLRRFAIEGLWGTAIGIFCFIILPLTAEPRPFDLHASTGPLLSLERQADPTFGNAFPSFHGFWALLVASALSRRSRTWAIASWTWAVLIILTCITTGMHSIADMLGAIALFLLVRELPSLYRLALQVSEHFANSFRSWHIGPIRIVNHAIWSFLAGAIGVLLIGYLAGPSHLLAITIVSLSSLIGAMLWAQLIEGSPRLLRPFGYYGAIVGGSVGCIAAWLVGANPCLLFAATAAAAPIIQAVGRVRCLVQGCCHGRPTTPSIGITIYNSSSRVCVLAHLDHKPIHPTQLYSILANLVSGIFLLRLYYAGCSQTLITGLYLAFAGLSRFVEESYRGEPQTRRWRGLPEYQWLAILSLLIGCILIALPFQSPVPTPQFSPDLLWLALVLGVITALFMSVDFPQSNRRFARLTG